MNRNWITAALICLFCVVGFTEFISGQLNNYLGRTILIFIFAFLYDKFRAKYR